MTLLLHATGLMKHFGSTRALAGAGLRVHSGEVIAVMGPSGSGKSTLLHCAAGIMRPNAGTVTFGGVELTSLSDRDLSALRRSEFGFVFQFGQLVPELTCLENAALPLRLAGSRRRAAEAAAMVWLDRFGVADTASRRSVEVSGGQAQRVAVARALVGGPKIIFADEPTGALDSLESERVMTLLATAARENNAAVVLVTHDAQVAAYSDRDVVVRDGVTAETEFAG